MLKIIQAPNSVLSTKAESVKKIDKSIRDLIKEMIIALDNAKDPEGVGLAAPQIGKSLQIFIARLTPKSSRLVFINPVLEEFINTKEKDKKSDKKDRIQLEGCLSLANIWGTVNRSEGVAVSYFDEKGIQHKKTFTGFMATIIQHEYDHLQGILFPKRVLEQNNKLYKSVKDKEDETVFEEIQL